MKNKIKLFSILLISTFALVSLAVIGSAHTGEDDYAHHNGMMGGMMSGMYGSYGYTGMIFGWVFSILFAVILILIIAWLIKQIQKK